MRPEASIGSYFLQAGQTLPCILVRHPTTLTRMSSSIGLALNRTRSILGNERLHLSAANMDRAFQSGSTMPRSTTRGSLNVTTTAAVRRLRPRRDRHARAFRRRRRRRPRAIPHHRGLSRSGLLAAAAPRWGGGCRFAIGAGHVTRLRIASLGGPGIGRWCFRRGPRHAVALASLGGPSIGPDGLIGRDGLRTAKSADVRAAGATPWRDARRWHESCSSHARRGREPPASVRIP